MAPAGTPAAVVNKLSAELAKAVNSPEIAEKLKAEGVEPVGSSPEELRQIIASEVPRWRKLIQDTGINPE
jgi:tripartite-type tricarboxylate transporter receptor subunit TctC